MAGWGSPSSTTAENEESVSDQAQREQEERHGAHFNYAHFQVLLLLFIANAKYSFGASVRRSSGRRSGGRLLAMT